MCGSFGTFAHQAYAARLHGRINSNVRPRRPVPKSPTVPLQALALASDPKIKGRIVRTYKDGLPILWTFVPEMPEEAIRRALPWMVVVSWTYDGTDRNGMPSLDVNEEMMRLDDALTNLERAMFCFEAYRRIGNGLREFIYYVSNCESFMQELNRKLESHPTYPIEIKFYDDEQWSDFAELIDDLGEA